MQWQAQAEAIKRVDHQIYSLIDDIAYFMGKRESHLKGEAAYLCYLGVLVRERIHLMTLIDAYS